MQNNALDRLHEAIYDALRIVETIEFAGLDDLERAGKLAEALLDELKRLEDLVEARQVRSEGP